MVQIETGDLMQIEAFNRYTYSIQADLIVANIIADVIIHLAGQIPAFLKPGGHFICSGIIKERQADVEAALHNNGYQIDEIKEKGSWIAICCHR